LYIQGNTVLTDIDGLTNVTSVAGARISGNPALTDINGLANLTSVDGDLQISNNLALASIDGLVNLTNLGWVSVIGNTALSNVDGLANLTSVERLVLGENNGLTNVDGLANLTSVSESLTIYSNVTLTNLDGLKSLTSVGEGVDSGGLYIIDNAALSNVDGLINLASVGGVWYSEGLNLSFNPTLSHCSALVYLLGWPDGPPNDNVDGEIVVSDNASGCNSVEDIFASIAFPTQPIITSSEAIHGQASLTYSPATTTDTAWPITGYYAECLADEQSVFQNPEAMDIPDPGSVVSTLTISGVPFTNSAGLNIEVDITHPRTRHLTLTLKSPAGTPVVLWDETVGDGENLLGSFPTTLEPAESLAAFDGQSFNGGWQLEVADYLVTQSGTLNSWGMTIRDKVAVMSDVSPVIMTGLTNYHTYSCTVSAVTGLGIGPASDAVSVMPIDPGLIFSDGFEDD
jgi:subtilisin-like proprotein convertase family protein